MVESFWVSFLYLFVISGSESLDGRDFINLSRFDYSVIEILSDIYIKFVNIPDVMMQINCSNCTRIDNFSIKCDQYELVKVDIEMEMKGFRISFPFNISCNPLRGRNYHIISDIDSHSGTNDILVSWASSSIGISHYYLIITDSFRIYTNKILRETSYRVENLKEKTWYEICIASIDRMLRTSKFNCTKVLTDFSTTGPVTNVTITRETDRIYIMWSRPEYEYDIPQGFIIYLQGRTNQMCRLYIIKRQLDINLTSQYSCVTTDTITSSLSSLEIKDLPPNSEFNIEISPFNRNKKTAIKYLTIKTKAGDCFTDCYIYRRLYPGIRSVTQIGRVCTNWKNYKYLLGKSNICIYGFGFRPWCPDTNRRGWDFCDVPECSSILSGTGCVDLLNKQEHVQSVMIQWSPPPSLIRIIGYLVLLHNSDHFCEQAIIQLCDTCGNIDALESQIKSLYLSCKSKEDKTSIVFQASFTDLHQNRNYNIYIAPIMSSSSVGEIRNITVRTTLAKPHIPNGVNYQLDTPRTIKFYWQPNIETQINGPADYYVAYITNRKNGKTISTRISTESVTFGDLEMCTEYCFVLNSVNVAGQSDYTREVCAFTLAPKPEKSVLVDPPSGYMRNLSLRWTYLGSDNCQKRYLVEYYVKFLHDGTLSSNTSHTSLVPKNLKLNVIYTVRVRAEGQMKTVNNENIGEFSPYKEFYTGTFSPTLSYYQHNLDYTNQILNVSWEIQQEIQGSIFMYIIRVKNITDRCTYSVLLECQTCREPWTWNNIKDQHGESLKNLTNCTLSLNGIIDADQTSFNYLLKVNRNFTTFSVDVYGVNLMGIHLLNGKSTSTASPVLFLVMVVIIIVVLLFFTILIYVKLKGNPLKLINKETELKNQSYLMSKTKEQEQERFWADRQLTLNTGTFISKVAISAFPAYYGEVSRNGSADLIKQFKKLTKEAKAQEVALELTVCVGKSLVISRKNHSLNILPYDQTRVKDGKTGVPLNYINASYIPFENNETQIEYIAAQGPFQETLSDFWEMIWEQNIHYIINLTRALENEKPKSLQYWPNSTQQNVTYGNENTLFVTLVREKKKKSHVERELFVLNTKCQTSRKIIQLHMHTWSDHSVPELNFFDGTLFRFHKITNDDTLHPYLVHCRYHIL